MKRYSDIEQLDLAQLESAAAGEDVKVPEDLAERVESAMAAAILAGGNEVLETDTRPAKLEAGGGPAPMSTSRRGRKRIWLPLAGIAAAAAMALLLILPHSGDARLQDTYDDPKQAYAQVEETFRMISSKMAGGVALAAESGRQAGRPAQIIDKINRK